MQDLGWPADLLHGVGKAHMTIGKKISLYSGFSLALMMATAGIAFVRIRLLDQTVCELADHSLPSIYSSGKMAGIAKDIRGNIRGHITANSLEEKAKAEKDRAKLEQDLTREVRTYEKSIVSAEERELFARIPAEFNKLLQTAVPIEPLSRDFKSQEAMGLFRSATMPAFVEVRKAIDAVIAWEHRRGNQNAANAAASAQSRETWTLVLLVFSALGGGAMSWYIVSSVNRVLRRSLEELGEASSQTANSAHQVSAASQSLAQGAAKQAASLEETSASTEQINSMTRKNAANSRQAASSMAELAERVKDANRTLGQMVASMNEINASSAKISKIIKVIDEIAFQTNILALNAAVEAARAGEAGMGFAVVAEEVRNLAQRSAQAAQDTAGLIDESIAKANDGKTKLDEVAVAMGSITASAAKVKALVDDMNHGTEEQARDIEEVAKALLQIEQVTQTTASSAQQGAAAGQQLSAQSETLRDVVSQLGALIGGGGAA